MFDISHATNVNGLPEYRYFAGGEGLAAEGNFLFEVCKP